MPGIDERALKESPLWAHMTEVMRHIVQERPANAVDVVDSVSHLVATGAFVPGAAATAYSSRAAQPAPAHQTKVPGDAHRDVAWAINFGAQLVPPKPPRKAPVDGEEDADAAAEEEEPQPDQGELADVIDEQATFNSLGEGLSAGEAFRVAVALKRLLDKEPLAKARFWGKITGTRRSYYVAETKIDEARVPEKEGGEEEEPAEETGKPPETIFQSLNNVFAARRAPKVLPEEAGKGVNEFVYYVATSDDLSVWTALPNLEPQHVSAARLIRKAFTGDLNAPVECHPQFPGLEKEYLRAQIARISATCTVAPAGIFTTEGATEEEEEDEDGNKKPRRFQVAAYEEIPPLNPQEPPDAEDAEAIAPVRAWFYGYAHDELLEPKGWTHIAATLLAEGRATKFRPDEEEIPEEDQGGDDDDAAAAAAADGADGGVAPGTELINPFLSDLSNDAPLSFEGHSRASFPAWTFRKGHGSESSTTRAYLARSVLWPGALCFAVAENGTPGARFQNVYVGNGLKRLLGRGAYAPPLPPRRLAEFPAKLTLQRDCTADDELEFAPLPPPPKAANEEDEEREE